MQIVNTYNSEQANKHFSRKEKILGQFFTPPEVAEFIVSFASQYVSKKKIACDPACGDGVFLLSLIKHGFEPLGVDIDKSVLDLLHQDIKNYVRIENGLTLNEEEKFDLVVGNPPFSSKYGRVKGDILKNFELGRYTSSQAIEILFLEKFIRLCSEGGVIGIILPYGIFSDLRLEYVREYIRKHLSIIAIISLPRNIFRSKGNKTSSKTCILIGKKSTKPLNEKILFAVVDSLEEFKKGIKRKIFAKPDKFLYPEFYLERNPVLSKLPKLKEFKIKVIQGSTKYGTERKFSKHGIPFISAKVVTPFGIDFSKDRKFIQPGSNMDIKNAYVEIGDVVFVRVGIGCIGRTAVITKESEKGIADDWIYIIRNEDDRLSPFYLSLWFQTPIIQKEIRRLARGVGTITIPITLVKELPIAIPPVDILKKCEIRYHEIISKRENGQYKKAWEIRDKILQELEDLIFRKELRDKKL